MQDESSDEEIMHNQQNQYQLLDSKYETNSVDEDIEMINSRRGLIAEQANTPLFFNKTKSKSNKESNQHVPRFISIEESHQNLEKHIAD